MAVKGKGCSAGSFFQAGVKCIQMSMWERLSWGRAWRIGKNLSETIWTKLLKYIKKVVSNLQEKISTKQHVFSTDTFYLLIKSNIAWKKSLRNNLFSLRNIFSKIFSIYRELLLETLFKHVNKYFNISRAFCARLCVHMCTMEINACMPWALCLSKREQVANLGSRRSSQTCGSTPWLHQCIHLRFRHTLGKVLQPFADVVWSLPVDRPVSIRASGNEPSLEAQDAHSIGQSATTAHYLLARQSVAPIAILPADIAPQPVWPEAGMIGAIWKGPHGMARDCFCRLTAGPGGADALPFPRLAGILGLPSAPSVSSVRESESDAHSASEMSCAADVASGLWLVFRLPWVLRFRFLIAVRPCASFAALAALWICFISSAARLKSMSVQRSAPNNPKGSKGTSDFPNLKKKQKPVRGFSCKIHAEFHIGAQGLKRESSVLTFELQDKGAVEAVVAIQRQFFETWPCPREAFGQRRPQQCISACQMQESTIAVQVGEQKDRVSRVRVLLRQSPNPREPREKLSVHLPSNWPRTRPKGKQKRGCRWHLANLRLRQLQSRLRDPSKCIK